MNHNATVFDLVLPRVLAGEKINREVLAEWGMAASVCIVRYAGIRFVLSVNNDVSHPRKENERQ